MKGKTLFCPICNENNKHYYEPHEGKLTRILLGLVTCGFGACTEYDVFCKKCKNHNYTYQHLFDRFIWERKALDNSITKKF